ncbi:MAG: NTP transferase domain-containing protein, partial [Novosphingobium sp.]|nr:NTP transferase domain-containing protein [Novosphingobium sp.]
MSELVSDTAMVMAAGLGKRMRPLTASQPKPLIRVGGKALIDYSLDGLAQAGVAKAVVNVH